MAEVQAAAPAAEPNPIAAIDAILAGENKPAPVEVPESDIDEPTGEPDVEGADAPTEQQAAPDEAAADDKPAMAEIPLEQLEAVELEVSVKGDDGKDVAQKLTVKELREGYMMKKDYYRKTAEVARQREQLGEQTRQAIESERTQYLQQLHVLDAVLTESVAPELKNVDWNALAANDAFEYVRLRNRADQVTQAKQAIQARVKEITDKQSAEAEVAKQSQAKKAREVLSEKIPEWNDALYQQLMTAGETYGYSAKDVGSWLDPRALQVLHDAYQFRQSKAPKPAPIPVAKKVAIPPKGLKPGASNDRVAQQAKKQESMGRLQKSGSIRDAAALIQTMIK